MANKKKIAAEEAEVSVSESGKAALDAAIMSLKKDYGKGILITNQTSFPEIDRIPSGSISLDYALGGGYARGRIIEISGAEGAGKTSLTLHAIASCQKQGGTCVFIDAEHALDGLYAQQLGVDMDQLIFSQPDSGEDALNVADALIRSGEIALIVIDSVAALTPRVEIEGNMGDSHIGLQARLMSQAMRKFAGVASKNNTAIIFTNQIRMKIGIMFGNPEVGSGGQALKFYASQRLDVRRSGIISEGEEKIGIKTKVKVIKNKVGQPFRETEFHLIFGKGIDSMTDLIDFAVARGIMEKNGAWYVYGERKFGAGSANAIKQLLLEPSLIEEIKNKILPATI